MKKIVASLPRMCKINNILIVRISKMYITIEWAAKKKLVLIFLPKKILSLSHSPSHSLSFSVRISYFSYTFAQHLQRAARGKEHMHCKIITQTIINSQLNLPSFFSHFTYSRALDCIAYTHTRTARTTTIITKCTHVTHHHRKVKRQRRQPRNYYNSRKRRGFFFLVPSNVVDVVLILANKENCIAAVVVVVVVTLLCTYSSPAQAKNLFFGISLKSIAM